MKITRLAQIGAIAAVGAIALAGCSSTAGSGSSSSPSASASANAVTSKVDPSLTGTITAGGSSAQANAQAAWTSAYNAQVKGVTINYDKSQGSGGGVTNFLSGAYDFAGSDSPLNADQTTKSQAMGGGINLPIYLDGVAIIFNIPGVTSLKLSGATIAKIFNLQITDWSDPAITADNGTALPAGPITTVARSDGSGTTQNFTNYLAATQAANWPYKAANSWPVTGNVSLQKGGSGVVNTVQAGAGTIGYADHSAIGTLSSAAIIQNGTAIPFSADAVTQTFAVASVPNPNGVAGDLSQKFDYSKLTTSTYPIPLVSYAVLPLTFKTATQATLTTSYLGFIASTAGQAVSAKNAGSAPLPNSILTQVQTSLGTVK
ncbi:substrate-binding domain-containing protein [Microbacterium sp. X-17]|uniref:substrate-binding domain-containing protein n=1 Tax=Microbacterium sp. X-17 TaxID=3144404 RepID=UPI0031F52637